MAPLNLESGSRVVTGVCQLLGKFPIRHFPCGEIFRQCKIRDVLLYAD
jgi:hypothetical protein